MNNQYPIYIDKYDKEKYIQETDTHIIAKGGDGTLLKAIKMHLDKKKPFFGIGAGTVNFLMNSEHEILDNAKYKSFNLIKVRVYFTTTYASDEIMPEMSYNEVAEFQAFNDVMIGGDMNSWIDFRVREKDELFGDFMGGGLIISTPQGSTGINKNNGGVVLPLSSGMWSITGDKTNRKIEYVIKPRKTLITTKSRRPVTVWVDGANHIIKNVSSVEISKGQKVVVAFNDYSTFMKKRRV